MLIEIPGPFAIATDSAVPLPTTVADELAEPPLVAIALPRAIATPGPGANWGVGAERTEAARVRSAM